MKAFIIAVTVLVLTFGLCTANDLYCQRVCEEITDNITERTPEGAENALNIFKRNELLLKCSVDNGYVTETRVSLESLIAAYQLNDEYEITRYIYDISIRTNRIKKALFI